jgi:cytoskeletal protein CcmA (bactofilin family)
LAPDQTERRATAWIGQGVTIEGRVSSAQDLRIDGRVDGAVEVGEHELVLGAGSEVKADLNARSILIGGTVIGAVVASQRLQVQATGSVVGSITAPQVVMLEGAVVNGKMDSAGSRRP